MDVDDGQSPSSGSVSGTAVGADDHAVPIVGIGASAGGLEALEELFRMMPEDSGAAFVVLQHLSPDFKSHMAELLGRVTDLRVQQADDTMPLAPNHVYLIPPRKDMIVAGGRLLLTDKEPAGLSRPIDHFFRSMAQEYGPRAIAIVLSGTGGDGTRGIRAVNEAGGSVIVQAPDESAFDGMPRSAIATGLVDEVLPAAEIAQAIARILSRHDPETRQRTIDIDRLPERQAIDLLLEHKQIDFNLYKPGTFSRRLRRRVELSRVGDMSHYVRKLHEDPEELDKLFHDLLIDVTSFFRDPHAYSHLQQLIEAEWLNDKRETIRIWVAGCATGQEAYSIAMLVDEARASRKWSGSIKVFATDVHGPALAQASEAVYGFEELGGVSEERRKRYFQREGDRYRIVDHLREIVVFARHDLTSNPPFTQLDLICCRNVLIYLKPEVQEKVLALFHFGLRTDGLLFLGPSETPGKLLDEFKQVHGSHQLFRKRRDVTLVAQTGRLAPATPRIAAANKPARYGRGLQSAYDALLDLYVPPGFLLDERHQLVHCFAGAERFLTLSAGRLQVRLPDLLGGRFRTAATALLHRLEEGGHEPQSVTIRSEDETGSGASYRLEARRLRGAGTEAGYLLVHVEQVGAIGEANAAGPAPHAAPSAEAVDTGYVEALERDLEVAQANLQNTVEELEASNEELQASNEELVASNEELQSTNEELHSVNEELSTVNVEYQKKIEQLSEVTADLDSLLQSINVGVLFLDQGLTIRRINAPMTALTGLGDDDLGTRFGRPEWLFAEHDLTARLRSVMAGEGEVEHEVRSDEGEVMLLSIAPYEGAANGVVVTLVDITRRRKAEAEAERLSAIVRNAREAIIGKDLDGTIRSWNQGAEALFGYAEEDIIGRPMSLLIPESHAEQEREILASIAAGREVAPIETMRIAKDGRRLHLQLSVSPVRADDGTIIGASTIAWDITARKLAEHEARSAVEQRDKFLAQLSHELRNPLMALSNANALLETGGRDERLAQRASGIISRQIRQMSRLLEDMLDASRMRYDKIELSRDIIDLRDVVAAALDTVRARAEAGGIELDVSAPDEPVRAHADGSRLQQVVVNLVQNAITHSSRGGRVTITVDADEHDARIVVADKGRGIRAEELELIFGPFFQGEGADAKGMGLGLALAKAIALAHGGDVVAASAGEGRGAAFELRLPVRTDTSSTARDLPALEDGSEPYGRSVLVVDDEAESREGLTLLLKGSRYDVVEAGDGEQALALIAETMPRVAIIDIGLPGIDGYEVARRVRREYGHQQVRLIALTGYGRQEDREAAMEAGFDLHLVKPIDFATIEKVIEYLASR